MSSEYWNGIYNAKDEKDVSWFQEVPEKSLELISELSLSLNAKIIDIGGGDSRLVDQLLLKNYSDITVLDISRVSLEKAKHRLGSKAYGVSFIESDVTEFQPGTQYDLWHDRATFHFLTKKNQIQKYLEIAALAIKPGGNLILSTFSRNGPAKCSGLNIQQYSDNELKELFGKYFANTKCFENSHVTPWGDTQSFMYCGFKKIGSPN